MKDPLDDVEIRPVQAILVPIATFALLIGGFVMFPPARGVILLIVGIAASIMLHELGHFIAAKKAGMKATEFFLGFGPRLWSVRKGETEYGVKALPLGGYVRIIGMSNLEDVDPDDEPRTYRQAKYKDKMCVAIAGIAMNVLICMVCVFIGLWGGGKPEGTITKAVDVAAPASTAGIRANQWVVSANGAPIADFKDLRAKIGSSADNVAKIRVVRNGEPVAVALDPEWFVSRDPARNAAIVLQDGVNVVDSVGGAAAAAGVQKGDTLEVAPVAVGVWSGGRVTTVGFDEKWLTNGSLTVQADNTVTRATGAAAKAGLRVGDRLVVVDHSYAGTPTRLAEVARPGVNNAQVLRGGAVTTVSVTPHITGGLSDKGAVELAGRIGVSPSVAIRPVGPLEAAKDAFVGVGTGSKQVVVAIAGFFTPDFIAKHTKAIVEGEPAANTPAGSNAEAKRPRSVIGIVSVGSGLVNQDIWNFFLLLASLNLFLALFNLLPMLPFDGGHLVVATYEKIASKIKGRDVHVDFRKLLPVTTAVTALLIVFGLSVMFRDVRDFFN